MRFLTTNEAAEILGVTVRRIRQLIKDGKLEAQLVGRDYIVSEDSLELAKERKTKPGPTPKVKAVSSTDNGKQKKTTKKK